MTPDHESQRHEHEYDEQFEVEIVDLAPDEAHNRADALVQLGLHFFARVHAVRSGFKLSFFSFLLLLITALLAGSAPYQPTIPLIVARPIFSSSISVNDMSGATFNVGDQGQGNGLQMRYSDNATIVIPGVAMGHSLSPGGVASWSAASMPANCTVNNDADAVYTSGHLSLWLVGARYPYGFVHLPHMTSSNLNSWKGWQLLIGILMKRGFTGPVTLTVSNHLSGPPPSFQGLRNEPPMTSLIVDLRKVPPYVAQSALRSRIIWSIPLYLPGAGCYTIQTQWPGGTHTITISAGQ